MLSQLDALAYGIKPAHARVTYMLIWLRPWFLARYSAASTQA